jgi:conjugative relaxase-like TrwC/TraI family protein
MLILAKITSSSAGGYAEYLEGKAQASELGDYYLKDGERIEAPGRWAHGAGHFGLDANLAVTGEQLRTLMAVRRPDTGEQLRRTGGSGEAVSAIDATFSAPKSVSAAWAIAGPELRQQIEQAHEQALDRALGYATRQVPMLRRRVSSEKVLHEKATGLVATSWRHTTARAVADQVPDPQLHSHVLLHAAVRRDGRLVAIDSRSWLVHQREVGAAYRTELAHGLFKLGFEVIRGTGRGGRYFEIDGIPQPLLDRWSSRHHQVQAAIRDRLLHQHRELEAVIARGGAEASEASEHLELMQKTSQLSPKQERLMGSVTRNAKTLVTAQDLDADWRHTALRHGVSRERIEVLRHQAREPVAPARPERVLEALVEFDATFAAREARAAALEQSAGTQINTALDQLQALRASGEILLLADGTGTTKDHRGYETAVVAITKRLAASTVHPIRRDAMDQETQRLDQELAATGGRLSQEQHDAITLACGEHPLVVIEGHAGTGKSTTLTGIARAHQIAGRQIIVTSTAALAAERLAAELTDHGVECTAYSTAGLHQAIQSGRAELGPDSTVIHDEAALASTREQLQIMRAVELSGARLIAVGDPQQNQPVGAGGLWERIEDTTRDAGSLVELTRNQRARDPADRHAQALFRQGEIELAIRTYAARNRIHFNPDERRTEDQALEAAHQDRTAGKSTLVIAQTSNEHLDELNARAQAIRQQDGQLGKERIPVPRRAYSLYAGDEIQIRHTLNHPGHGQLRNGTNAIITHIDPRSGELGLRLPGGDELTLEGDQIEQADLRLAYAQHPFPAQGHTADTAHVIIGPHGTREGTYVALTRAREQTHLYDALPAESREAGALEALAERVSHAAPDIPSIAVPLAHEGNVTAHEGHATSAQTAETTHYWILCGSRQDRSVGVEDDPSGVGARTFKTDAPVVRGKVEDRADRLVSQDDAARELEPRSTMGQGPERDTRWVWPREVGSPCAPDRKIDGHSRETTDGWEM